MDKFRAYRIHASKEGTRAGFEELAIDDLTPGEVVIKAAWSDINYKDALAATGKGRILRTSPLNGGIDVSGQVVSSSDPRFKEGDPVLVCGCGLSETIDGGYSEYVRVPAWSVVPLPDGLSLRDVMAIGTAGFTAAIAVQRMQDNGQVPETGPIVVTGATGGVGSFAIDMLAALGYEVLAYTGKVDQEPYLRELGASGLLNRKELEMGTKPLENAQWGGAVDSVGGETLAWLTRTTNVWGNIASVGLAGGFKLETTVMPFILRGVSLLGINSVECPQYVRERAWSRLAGDLRPRHLDTIAHREVSLDQLPAVFGEYVDAAVTGRTVVRIGG
jgi:NADPH2:quinone reductase